MRKVIILIILVFFGWACWITVVEGFNIGTNFNISNYKVIDSSSKQVDTLISKLINLNDIEYPEHVEKLELAKKEYQNKKEEYEELKALTEQTSTEDEISLVDIYDVDFLWTIIGNYATEEGISLKFDIGKSINSRISSLQYTICDLKFTISGDYIALTDFIYDLEDDSRLGFEISNFYMAVAGDDLQATFTVRNVPINNENLTEFTTSVDTKSKKDNKNTTTSSSTTEDDDTN